jgi:hypothetical protein
MGAVRFGVPTELALKLKDTYGLSTFIETGTYQGGTSTWASKHFARVVTIEFYDRWWKMTTAKYGQIPNIEFLLGDSRLRLPETMETLQDPAVVWLDGHYCGNLMKSPTGKEDECPIIEEIDCLMDSPFDHYILIDDARCFDEHGHSKNAPKRNWPAGTPTPKGAWPRLYEVAQALTEKKDYFLASFEDVLIAVPRHAEKLVREYCEITRKGYSWTITG